MKAEAMLTIELPAQPAQAELNLRRWEELLHDPELANFEGRVETDRHGRIIMSPPPAASHGSYQSEIAHLLRVFLPEGRPYTECPVSTADGVKAVDVAWASAKQVRALGKKVCFLKAPEICVEVLSPSNSANEIAEKRALYFDAGAKEVWICDRSGKMKFFEAKTLGPLVRSNICPNFPGTVVLGS